MAHVGDDDRAELIAYLDGELGEKESQAFEARLGRDPGLRAEAETMKKTWELLDYLPRPEPSANFTHQTLERLALQDRPGGWAKAGRWPSLVPAGWAAGVLLALGAGLLAASRLWPTGAPNDHAVPAAKAEPTKAEIEIQMVREMDVIRNRRLYENVDDVEFARKLPEVMDDEEGQS
jgi:anti-sigma factor RsiW